MSTDRAELARDLLEHSLENRTIAEDPAPELVRGVHVAVYGAGKVGRQVAALLAARGVIVDRMIDARALQLRSMDGIPVVPPGTSHQASMPTRWCCVTASTTTKSTRPGRCRCPGLPSRCAA